MIAPFTSVMNFPPRIREAFEKAGWYPDRAVGEATRRYPPAIQSVERELGGLCVQGAVEAIFSTTYSTEDFEYYNEVFGRNIYPIGRTVDYWHLCVDEHGSVYLLGNWMTLMGKTFQEGITVFLRGEQGLDLNEEKMTWGPKELVLTWPDLPSTT